MAQITQSTSKIEYIRIGSDIHQKIIFRLQNSLLIKVIQKCHIRVCKNNVTLIFDNDSIYYRAALRFYDTIKDRLARILNRSSINLIIQTNN